MATIKTSLLISNPDPNTVISLDTPTLCKVGSCFTNPKLVDFPIYTDNTIIVAPAIVNGEDVEKVKSCLDKIATTDENDCDGILRLRRMIATLPIRLFVRAIYKEFVIDLVTTDGVTTATHKLGGEFCENLRKLVSGGEITASELQDAITKAASGKRIVAHADGTARNSRGRNYTLLKYDLE